MQTLFFLSGLPRSGSTILGNVLNQNQLIYTTTVSPLNELLFAVNQKLQEFNIQYTYNIEETSSNIYSALAANFHRHINKNYIIDKHRSWPQNIPSIIKYITKNPKIIVTYRPIPEIITSYITLIESTNHIDNFIDNDLKSQNLEVNNDNRAKQIWKYYVSPSYVSIIEGLRFLPKAMHLINYNDLIDNPKEEIEKIYNFLEIPYFEHDFNNILNTSGPEKDEAWGLEGLHSIRPKLEKISRNPNDIIGEDNVKLYSKFNLFSTTLNSFS